MGNRFSDPKDLVIPFSVPICMSPICDYFRVSDKPSTPLHFSVAPILDDRLLPDRRQIVTGGNVGGLI
jgi:hypothetical protein